MKTPTSDLDPHNRTNPGMDAPLERAQVLRLARWLAGGAVIGALAGFAGSFLMTPQWEAHGMIRGGQVASPDGAPVVLEHPALIAERLNAAAFAADVQARMGGARPAPGAKLEAVYVERSSVVRFRTRAASRDEALRYAQAALDDTLAIHEHAYRPAVERLEARLRAIEGDIARIEAERARIDQRLQGARTVDETVLRTLLERRDAELTGLREAAARADALLPGVRTYPTAAFEKVVAELQPAYPNRAVSAVAGVIAGMMLGAAAALLRPARP